MPESNVLSKDHIGCTFHSVEMQVRKKNIRDILNLPYGAFFLDAHGIVIDLVELPVHVLVQVETMHRAHNKARRAVCLVF